MAKTKKQRFKFTTRQMKAGDDVRALQCILTKMGYLRRGRDPGRMCDCTCGALRHFQKCYGPPDTGEADEKTLSLIERPRCGVPDIDPTTGSGSGPAPFVLRGCEYDRTDLTFAFVNSTPDLATERQREIIAEAFSAWAAVSPLRFTEVSPAASPDFPIAFERGNHGDGSSFDDGGNPLTGNNTLAHAFFPPPCGGPFAGAFHLDEFETWADAAAPDSIRLLNVSIHEIGHLLGLDHSNVNDALMFAFYDENVDRLRPDDVAGIQAIYGGPTAGTPIIRGELSGDGDSQLHPISSQPGRLTARLCGPIGQDFDLYVRVGLRPTRTSFDARGFSSSSNEEVTLNVNSSDVFALVDSWLGNGKYELEIEFG